MDSRTVLRGFNDHFVEFIDDVQRLFPEDRDVRTAHTALVGARKANPVIICKIWQKVVLRQNRAEIESGDLDHFARKDYSRNFPQSMAWIVARIDNFRRPLVELEAGNKEKIVQYLRNLTQLSDLYFSKAAA